MTSPIETNNVVERQFERLIAVEDALANGAHFADDPECHPLYPQAVAARQILQAHVQSLSDRIDVLEGLVPFLGNIAQMLDEMKVERGQHPTIEWTAYNQEQRDELTRFLRVLSNG